MRLDNFEQDHIRQYLNKVDFKTPPPADLNGGGGGCGRRNAFS